MHDEDDVHVLFTCCFAHELWVEMGFQQMVVVEQNDTVMEILKRVFCMENTDQCVMVGLLCWSLRFRRSKWVWDRVNTFVFGVKSMATSMLADWRRAMEQTKSQPCQNQVTTRAWCKPPAGWIKINVDAACNPREVFLTIACVARDERGRFLRVRIDVIRGRLQPREAEALSLKEALSWTKQWRDSKCIFESDAKLLVDTVKSVRWNSYFDTIDEDCGELLKHFDDEVLLVFMYRSVNPVAHLLVRVAYSVTGLREWISTAPNFIACNLVFEEF